MPEITALTPSTRRRGRLLLYLDHRFAASLDGVTVAMHGLKVGKNLTTAEIAALERDAVVGGLVDRALRFLSFRPRSEAELRAYLRRLEATPEQVDAALADLRRQRLVDDEAFARFWRESRDRSSPRGESMLRAELRAKGLATEVVAGVMPDDEEQAALARRAAEGRLRSVQGLPWPEFRSRLLGFLQRRGFGYDTANAAVRELWATSGNAAASDEEPGD